MKERLKQRLFASISAQIDAIGYVPDDIGKLVGDFQFAAQPIGTETAASPSESSDKGSLASRINRHYDEMFYGQGRILDLVSEDNDYRNIGYWDANTKTLREASERLQDALLDFIPEKSGRILDVPAAWEHRRAACSSTIRRTMSGRSISRRSRSNRPARMRPGATPRS
nr:methyltransferase [uncultured bacterium]